MDKIRIIKNGDKDTGWKEYWKHGRPLDCIPHSMRVLLLGGVDRGKTNIMKNLFLAHQMSKKPFKRLYVICCNTDSVEWLDMEPDLIQDTIPSKHFLKNEKNEKTLIVMDDYEFESISADERIKLSSLFRNIASHKNISVLLSYQSFFDTPPLARKCANFFVIYKPESLTELATIADRVGLEKNVLKNIFKRKATGRYDFVCVDKTPDSPAPVRVNLHEVIDIEDYAD